jgi:hypothetical protein
LILAREWPTHTRDLFYFTEERKTELPLLPLTTLLLLVDDNATADDDTFTVCRIEVYTVAIGLLYIEMS